MLALDTATECCSAALLIEDRLLTREAELARGHAERILTMIDELLGEAGIGLREVRTIAFGRGPGSFTGLRLAASVAQGLAFGAGLGVVAISDLRALAQRVFDEDSGVTRALVCNDARMKEVYWGCFERGSDGLALGTSPERVGPPDTVELPSTWTEAAGVGRGFAAYPALKALEGVAVRGSWERLLPRAAEVARLAVPELIAGRLLAPEAAVPVYLRDDVARPPP
ncbi:MAG TPA: tRNA (adenosine(37)-N6)-threonylcarbamoyltransferase complex dimerization subunit type 1 TsaB [Steroidobacteraceae bacterium]|jgi:tRNA threonylcarbamoyladenosine biosynthesis protein TsaB|nr:tRNA (adenosine(37)-N6)-threonylcarbamoyltransferase complex dimerization subunit type 1 TsaB [Steroidobacteraceae bacterium]